jgi:protein tyrosine/serine phosphatase
MGLLVRFQRLRYFWRLACIAAVLFLMTLAGLGMKSMRGYWLPIRVAAIEQGGIVRGAHQSPRVMQHLIDKYHFRTIINLDDKVLDGRDDPDRYREEKQLARRLNIRYVSFLWTGNGRGLFSEYDAVADLLADPANRPVFVHCAAGEKRTNAALAAYLIRCRGYTIEQVIGALSAFNLTPDKQPKQIQYLREYSEYVQQHRRTSDAVGH